MGTGMKENFEEKHSEGKPWPFRQPTIFAFINNVLEIMKHSKHSNYVMYPK